jgi:hypothetical protein
MDSRPKYSLLTGVLLLAACGGGDDSDPQSPPPGPLPDKLLIAVADGAWAATWIDPVTQERKATRAFVTGPWVMQVEIAPATTSGAMLAPNAWFVTSVDRPLGVSAGSAVTAQTIGLGEGAGTATITYSFSSGAVNATIEHANKTYAILFQRDRAEPTRISPRALSGVYSGTFGSQGSTNWTLTIQEDGRITGSDAYGCTWTGNAATSGSGLNAFRLTMEATGCPSTGQAFVPVNGSYVAMGRIAQADPTRTKYPGQDVIDFTIVGPVWLGPQVLAK